jgi:polysaccharide transporter, PST family
MADDVGSASELREATLAGVRWLTMSRGAAEVLTFGSAVLLARLISPAEFGRAAIALVFGGVAIGLTNEGFGNPIVQRARLTMRHIESAAFMSIASGVILTVATLLLAPLVCDPLFGSRTTELVQLVSPVFLVTAVGIVPVALLQRDLNFRRTGLAEVAAALVGTATAVALALAGLNGEALVLGLVVTRAVSSILLFAMEPSMPRLSRREAGDIASFGGPAALASMLSVGIRNVDYAIVAAKLGATATGLYYRGFQVGVGYQTRASDIMFRVAFPIYSRAAQTGDMVSLRDRIVPVNATILFPFLAFLIATAPDFIPWLFGQTWAAAAVPTQFLCVAGMAAVVFNPVGPLLLAAGRPGALVRFHLLFLLLLGTGVFVATGGGIDSVAAAVAGVHLVILPLAYWMGNRYAGIAFSSLVRDLAAPVTASAALLAVAVPATAVLGGTGIPTVLMLLAVGCLGGAAYVLVLRTFFAQVWSDVCLLVTRLGLGRLLGSWTARRRRVLSGASSGG